MDNLCHNCANEIVFQKQYRSVGTQFEEFPQMIPTPAVMSIENMPDDVMLVIFKQMGLTYKREELEEETLLTSQERNILNIMLVCKKWKTLVEEHHIFKCCNFFNEERTLEEHLMMLRSTRKFQSLKFSAVEDIKTQLLYLKLFLADINQRHQIKAEISFENYSVVGIGSQQLRKTLKVFKRFEKISLYLDYNLQNPSNKQVKFTQLKSLAVTGPTTDIIDFKSYIKAPKLTHLNLYLTDKLAPYEDLDDIVWGNVMTVPNYFCNNLQNVNICFNNSSLLLFHWSPNSLSIRGVTIEFDDNLKQFLENRLDRVRSIYVRSSDSWELNNLIWQNSNNATDLDIDQDFVESLDRSNLSMNVANIVVEGMPVTRDEFMRIIN